MKNKKCAELLVQRVAPHWISPFISYEVSLRRFLHLFLAIFVLMTFLHRFYFLHFLAVTSCLVTGCLFAIVWGWLSNEKVKLPTRPRLNNSTVSQFTCLLEGQEWDLEVIHQHAVNITLCVMMDLTELKEWLWDCDDRGLFALEWHLEGGKKMDCIGRKNEWMAEQVFVSKSNILMQICKHFSYSHTFVISVSPQTSSMQKREHFPDFQEPKGVIWMENGQMKVVN